MAKSQSTKEPITRPAVTPEPETITITLTRVAPLTMCLRTAQAEGVVDGRKVELSTPVTGGLWLDFKGLGIFSVSASAVIREAFEQLTSDPAEALPAEGESGS